MPLFPLWILAWLESVWPDACPNKLAVHGAQAAETLAAEVKTLEGRLAVASEAEEQLRLHAEEVRASTSSASELDDRLRDALKQLAASEAERARLVEDLRLETDRLEDARARASASQTKTAELQQQEVQLRDELSVAEAGMEEARRAAEGQQARLDAAVVQLEQIAHLQSEAEAARAARDALAARCERLEADLCAKGSAEAILRDEAAAQEEGLARAAAEADARAQSARQEVDAAAQQLEEAVQAAESCQVLILLRCTLTQNMQIRKSLMTRRRPQAWAYGVEVLPLNVPLSACVCKPAGADRGAQPAMRGAGDEARA